MMTRSEPDNEDCLIGKVLFRQLIFLSIAKESLSQRMIAALNFHLQTSVTSLLHGCGLVDDDTIRRSRLRAMKKKVLMPSFRWVVWKMAKGQLMQSTLFASLKMTIGIEKLIVDIEEDDSGEINVTTSLAICYCPLTEYRPSQPLASGGRRSNTLTALLPFDILFIQ